MITTSVEISPALAGLYARCNMLSQIAEGGVSTNTVNAAIDKMGDPEMPRILGRIAENRARAGR